MRLRACLRAVLHCTCMPAVASSSHYLHEPESCEMLMEGGRCSTCGHDAHNGFVLFAQCGNVAAPLPRCVASLPASARI